MEIRVFCNKLVTLNNFNDLKIIRLNVLSYNLKQATLTGDVKISGEYLKEENYEMGFEEIVPFTVVFRNDKIKVNNILIENDKFNTLNNQGVDVSFELVVNYDLIEDNEIDDSNSNIFVEVEKGNFKDEEIIEVPVEIDEEVQMVYNDEKNNILIETEKITEEYDKLLSEILNVRHENETKNVTVKKNQINNVNKVSFKNQTTTYDKLSVYYVTKENEIETISKEKRISISDIYKQNSDFEKTRRIIINE